MAPDDHKALNDQVNSLAITVGNLEQTVETLVDRVGDIEHQQEAISKLPLRVAELKGLINGLQAIVTARFDQVQPGVDKIDKLASLKYLLQFSATVIVPILVALIGAFFVLRAGGVGAR